MNTRTRGAHRQKLTTALFAAIITFAGAERALSCAPEFPEAVMINGIHPDLPLKHFAAGRLGIIQPGWAQSYQIVAYRYLSGKPLNKIEQSSLMALWCKRLGGSVTNAGRMDYDAPDAVTQYFTYRAQVQGKKLKAGSSHYDFNYCTDVFDDAFANALATLKELVKRYGKDSSAVKSWLASQDNVFGVNDKRKQSEPAPLIAEAKADPYLAALHAYQEAAAKLYAGDDFDSARKQFEALAKNPHFANSDLAQYLAARCCANAAMPPNDTSTISKALAYVRGQIEANPRSKHRADLLDLCDMLQFEQGDGGYDLEHLSTSILNPNNERLGGDIGSMTRQLDSFMPANLTENEKAPAIKELKSTVMKSNDLVDWVLSFQQSNAIWYYSSDEEKNQIKKEREENARHCLARWRATHTLPWLVAAVSYNNPLDKGNHDLLVAASAVPPQSPAYLTAQFYLIDGLLQAGRLSDAKKHLLPILSRTDLTPSSRNLFLSQRLVTSGSAPEYLKSAVQTAQATPSYSNTTQMPDNWYALESKKDYVQVRSAFANGPVAQDINKNLPQSYWLALAKNSALPQPLRPSIVRAAWLRSKLLEQDNADLDKLMVQYHPALKEALNDYTCATDPKEKRFALACLVFNNYSMSPYVDGGIERHGLSMKEFDYYQANFWQPFAPEEAAKPRQSGGEADYEPLGAGVTFIGSDQIQNMVLRYSKPRLNQILTAAEKKQAAQERRIIYAHHPSKFLGQAVLDWAAAHPNDPRVPHLLYVVVKLPKWSGGQEQSENLAANKLSLGSKYSRQAYLLLHRQYPSSRWAQAAPCWY